MAINLNFTEAEKEYNAFGPWICKIDETYPLPRLFAPYFKENDNAIIKLKVPRDIDRRNANPDMHLYDYVLALYPDELRILERRDDDTVAEHFVHGADFMGIRVYKNLLLAGCTLYSVDGATSFSFNSVSMDLAWEFANLVIDTLGKSTSMDISSLPVTEAEPETSLLQNMLHDLRLEKKDIILGAVQKGVDVYRREDTTAQIERIIWKEMNPEALHLYDDKQLIILEHGFFPNRIGMPDFGYTYTIIPLNKLTAVQMSRSKQYSLLMDCTIYLGRNQLVYHYDVDNTEVETFYEAVKKL